MKRTSLRNTSWTLAAAALVSVTGLLVGCKKEAKELKIGYITEQTGAESYIAASSTPAATAWPGLPACQRLDGFLPLLWDEAAGRLYIELRRLGEDLLYVDRLSHAIGDYRLERATLSRPTIVRFERRGARVFLLAPNVAWRTSSPEPAQQLAVRQAFPESILWSFAILGEQNGALLLDGTDFFLRDSRGIAETLSGLGDGRFTLDLSRCAITAEGTRSFPLNSQAESILTFSNPSATRLPFWNANGRKEGLAALAPDPRSITIRLRHCFIQLPDDNYRPREFDPRSSFFNSLSSLSYFVAM